MKIDTNIYNINYFNYVLKQYGVTREQWEKTYKKQVGKCAICRRRMRLVIDHCHKTGKFRGLLCYYCNCILGKISKHPIILKNIPTYLHVVQSP